MPQCVSCGRYIPTGKFFCDDCYKKMRGRKGKLKKVEQKPPAGKDVLERTSREPGSGVSPEQGEQTPAAAGDYIEKHIRNTLTPASGKKVVSLKPGIDKDGEKSLAGQKKRFKITITLSERTYMALARFKLRRKEGPAAAEGGMDKEPLAEKPGRAKKKKVGPHGRPKLKAISSEGGDAAPDKGLKRFVAYRRRKWDKGDITAAAMATAVMILSIVLMNIGWIRLIWSEAQGIAPETLELKGTDLGAPIYVIAVLVCAAWLYLFITRLARRAFLKVDYGLVLLLVGLIFIIVLFMTISSNDRITGIAAEMIGKADNYFRQGAYSYERQTLWTAYIMVLLGCAFAFSGLIRLSERGKGAAGEKRS
ncbi:MAG: hypothetical protein ACOC78_03275 [Actinomycetota bacterium]